MTWPRTPVAVITGPDWMVHARQALHPSEQQGQPVASGQSLPLTALPFTGGLVGWLGYESGRFVEKMPRPRHPGSPSDASPPDLALWRCDGGLCYHWPSQRWHIGGQPEFVSQAAALLERAEPQPSPTMRPGTWSTDQWRSQDEYQDAVREILHAIHEGDVYQVNLAWEQRNIPVSDPMQRWLGLRAANPAERGAFVRLGQTTLMSNSPELYLSVSSEGTLRSVPIKGTVPCAAGDAGRLHLWESEKERAELTMIVDLVRNDLGRIARVGTVRAAPRRLRRCGDLLHAEQEVTARLREGADAFDAVAATFPPGSVTGAPKVAALALINRLENQRRGVYTGAMGFFCDDGRAHLNVAIRTAVVEHGTARFHVGAGIVADSDPEREWEETLAKGRALGSWLVAQ